MGIHKTKTFCKATIAPPPPTLLKFAQIICNPRIWFGTNTLLVWCDCALFWLCGARKTRIRPSGHHVIIPSSQFPLNLPLFLFQEPPRSARALTRIPPSLPFQFLRLQEEKRAFPPFWQRSAAGARRPNRLSSWPSREKLPAAKPLPSLTRLPSIGKQLNLWNSSPPFAGSSAQTLSCNLNRNPDF